MREDQIEQAERQAVFANDRRVREQAQRGATYKAFADADTEIPGRFQSIAAAHVIGSTPTPATQYPACSPALAVQLPDEPPLSFDNPALDPSAGLSAAEQLGGAAVAPSAPPDVESAPPSFSEDQDNG
jgi:hypothetical protein